MFIIRPAWEVVTLFLFKFKWRNKGRVVLRRSVILLRKASVPLITGWKLQRTKKISWWFLSNWRTAGALDQVRYAHHIVIKVPEMGSSLQLMILIILSLFFSFLILAFEFLLLYFYFYFWRWNRLAGHTWDWMFKSLFDWDWLWCWVSGKLYSKTVL